MVKDLNWQITAALDYEGLNYTAGQLKQDLKSFFQNRPSAEYSARDDWQWGYFECRVDEYTRFQIELCYPKYSGSFNRVAS